MAEPRRATIGRVGGGVGLGLLAVLFGLLPWLATGGRAPTQNLWATTPGQMPFVLLPFSQYHVTSMIGILVVGAVLAGVLGRMLRARLGRWGTVALVATVLVLQLLALAQTALEIHAGLEAGAAARIYLATLVAVAGLAILSGLVAALLVIAPPRAAAVVGVSIGALALGPWLLGPWIGMDQPLQGAVQALGLAARWVPPVAVGVAVARAGLRTAARVVAAALGLVLLWIVPALTKAIQSTLGSRAVLQNLGGAVEHFLRVLVQSATGPIGLLLPPLVVCLAVAAAGMLVHERFANRSSPASPGSRRVG